MTKPITGAATQLLVDDGMLALDDRASAYLPGFDTDASREITIEQLLTHTSGLPLTTLQSTHDYESLNAMANATGEGGPEFAPGSKFWYSDAGADVLGAIVEQVSGSDLEDFVTDRLLKPLTMEDAHYPGDPGDPGWTGSRACTSVGEATGTGSGDPGMSRSIRMRGARSPSTPRR